MSNAFSSGFGAGTRLGGVRIGQERNAIAQQQVDQQQLQFQQDAFKNLYKEAATYLKDNAAAVSKSIGSASSPQARQRLIEDWDKVVEPINVSLDRTIDGAVQSGLVPEAQGNVLKQTLRMQSRLSDPIAEIKAEEQVKAEVAVDKARQVSKIEAAEHRVKTATDEASAIRLAEAKRTREAHDIEGFYRLPDGRTVQATKTGVYDVNTKERLDSTELIGMTPLTQRELIETRNLDLSPAVVTDQQKTLLMSQQIAEESRDLASRLRAADVGFRGVVGEKLIDETIGQLFQSAVDKDRVANRQAIRTLREKALRPMTTDNRLNIADRAGVEKIFPRDTVIESLPAAREKLISLAELMEERAARAAGILEGKAAHQMTVDEIVDAIKSEKMDSKRGARLLRVYHGYE